MHVSSWIFSGFVIGGVGGFGVTAGAHRFWCHRAYKANLPLRIILMLCYVTAGQVCHIKSKKPYVSKTEVDFFCRIRCTTGSEIIEFTTNIQRQTLIHITRTVDSSLLMLAGLCFKRLTIFKLKKLILILKIYF